MYLTYDEYKEYGGSLEQTVFNDLELEAEMQVNWYTFDRLVNEETIPERVKQCVYKLISILNDKQKASAIDAASEDGTVQAGIASESNDGVSTSYNTLSAKDAVELAKSEIENTIRMYLSSVKNSLGRKLLYKGVYPDE